MQHGAVIYKHKRDKKVAACEKQGVIRKSNAEQSKTSCFRRIQGRDRNARRNADKSLTFAMHVGISGLPGPSGKVVSTPIRRTALTARIISNHSSHYGRGS